MSAEHAECSFRISVNQRLTASPKPLRKVVRKKVYLISCKSFEPLKRDRKDACFALLFNERAEMVADFSFITGDIIVHQLVRRARFAVRAFDDHRR
ncbi:MAG: hypothetical protein CNIPEHKO_00009 [Anaerolineales bacterium]|nr:hypothetical protein [Anaerolineales bacterium]